MGLGDRLEVEHRVAGSGVTYLHHGIDMGDGTVVHARPHDFRRPFGGGRVERTTVAEFAAGRQVRTRREPVAAFRPAEIAARAAAHVGREGYSLLVDNCEHFATWCATGRRTSRQVDLVLSRVAAAVSRTAAAVSARVAAGAAERAAIRTALGGPVRLGLGTLLPAAVVGEAAALVAEWRAHQHGRSLEEGRRAAESAGLAASAAACAVAGARAGAAGIVTGAVAGAALWLVGSVAAATARSARPAPADQRLSAAAPAASSR